MAGDELFHEAHHMANEMLGIRDKLQTIADGEIERGRCLPGTIYPGKRKMKLADAQSIAKHAVARIDQIVNRFYDKTQDKGH